MVVHRHSKLREKLEADIFYARGPAERAELSKWLTILDQLKTAEEKATRLEEQAAQRQEAGYEYAVSPLTGGEDLRVVTEEELALYREEQATRAEPAIVVRRQKAVEAGPWELLR